MPQRPLAVVYQTLNRTPSSTTPPDLNTLILGPCYDLKDYPDDAAEILLDSTYGRADQPSGGTDAYTPPTEGSDELTVVSYPGQNPGSIVDHGSVRVFLRQPRVIIGSTQAGQSPSLGTHVKTDETDQTLLAFPLVDIVALGVRPGDKVMLTSSRGTQSVVRTIASVGEPDGAGLATDTSLCRVTQNLPASDTHATGSVVCVAGSALVDGQTLIIDDGDTTVTFEFNNDAAVSGGHTSVPFTAMSTAEAVRDALVSLINASALHITATASGAATILLVNDIGGSEGNVAITETVMNAGFIATGMSNGAESSTTWAYNDAGECRIERALSNRELVDAAHDFITFPDVSNDTMVLKGGITLDTTLSPVPSVATPSPSDSTAALTLSYAGVYLSYRALRQDLQDVASYSKADITTAGAITSINGLGRVDARNPLAAGVRAALSASGTKPILAYGVSSDNTSGHLMAQANIESRKDAHLLVVLSSDADITASYKFSNDSLGDPTTALQSGVPQKLRCAIAGLVFPTVTTVYEGSLSGVAQQSGTATSKRRTLSILNACAVSVASVMPGDSVTIGCPANGAPAGWQNRRGVHTVGHVNNNYTDTPAEYPAGPSVIELIPGSSRWDDTSATSAGDVELLIKAPDGTVRVSKLGTADVTVNGGKIRWAMKAPTVEGGPYTVVYSSGSAARVSLSGFVITVTYVTGATTHNAVAALVLAHTVLSSLVTATVVSGGTAVINATVASTRIEVQSSVCTASIIVNDNLFDRLEDAGAQLLSAGVRAGDTLEIPINPNDYSPGAWDGRLLSLRVAQVLNENRVKLQVVSDDTGTAATELPHYYKRNVAGYLDNTAPNSIRYRIRRALSKDEQVEAIASYAQSFASKRVILVGPDLMDVDGLVDGSLPRSNPAVPALAGPQPGFYAAAVIGGACAGLPVQHGLSRLGLPGIKKLYHANGYFSETQLTHISNGGVFMLQQPHPTDLPSVIHQLTTDVSANETGELSVVRTIDFVSIAMLEAVDEFIGPYNVLPETQSDLLDVLNAEIRDLKSGYVDHIGAPLTEGTINTILVKEGARDRYEVNATLTVPGPVNGVDLRLVFN